MATLIFVAVHEINAAMRGPASATVAANTPNELEQSITDAEWQQEMLLLGLATTTDPGAISENDPISMIGPYVAAQLIGEYAGLKEQGRNTPENMQAAAESIARNVRASVSYKTYAVADISTDTDTSYERMLTYRADMRTALEPLFMDTGPEFEVFAHYVETSDPVYLEQLTDAAEHYRAAAENAAKIVVPKDAVNYHRAILNALQEFAATLDAMSEHADDPMASVALLRTYNTAELNMLNSFNDLPSYYRQKTP